MDEFDFGALADFLDNHFKQFADFLADLHGLEDGEAMAEQQVAELEKLAGRT